MRLLNEYRRQMYVREPSTDRFLMQQGAQCVLSNSLTGIVANENVKESHLWVLPPMDLAIHQPSIRFAKSISSARYSRLGSSAGAPCDEESRCRRSHHPELRGVSVVESPGPLSLGHFRCLLKGRSFIDRIWETILAWASYRKPDLLLHLGGIASNGEMKVIRSHLSSS